MREPIEGMVDVGGRDQTARRAVAEGYLLSDPDTIDAFRNNNLPKADPLPTARAAALLAVKQTPQMIPHCHPIRVTNVRVRYEFAVNSVRVECAVEACDRTGPEMEALQGCVAALLTLYDICKAVAPGTELRRIALVEKEGGRSGHWTAGGA